MWSYLDQINFMMVHMGNLSITNTISIDHNPLWKASLVVFHKLTYCPYKHIVNIKNESYLIVYVHRVNLYIT